MIGRDLAVEPAHAVANRKAGAQLSPNSRDDDRFQFWASVDSTRIGAVVGVYPVTVWD